MLAATALTVMPIAGIALTSASASAATTVNVAHDEAASIPGSGNHSASSDTHDTRFFGVVKAVARGFTAAKAPQAAGRVLQQAGVLGYSSTSTASKDVEAAFFDH
ncbi:hypothetical protein [Frondihabitans sp. PAMC 28766]|uniref:hypothetical protein n=1 Tax=Frondihabitans sp. PAMC 28766 TaxID=1795630 RepID=UPI000ADD9A1E|nr:hypothetical protein [Frondihabitans sp. PAMC 28766]